MLTHNHLKKALRVFKLKHFIILIGTLLHTYIVKHVVLCAKSTQHRMLQWMHNNIYISCKYCRIGDMTGYTPMFIHVTTLCDKSHDQVMWPSQATKYTYYTALSKWYQNHVTYDVMMLVLLWIDILNWLLCAHWDPFVMIMPCHWYGIINGDDASLDLPSIRVILQDNIYQSCLSLNMCSSEGG